MRFGVSAGPFWVSSGGRRNRRHRRAGPFSVVFFAALLIAGLSVTAADWLMWIGFPALIVLGLVARHQARRPRRPAPEQFTPRNPQAWNSNRR